MTPLNAKLRFITPDGKFDRPAIGKAIVAKAQATRDLDDAHRYIWSEARGEMALYEMRVLTRAAGLPTVSDQVHGRASDITLIAAE